jgi:hypothetical protein
MRIGGDALFAGSLAALAGPLAPALPHDTDPAFADAYTACLAVVAGGLPSEYEGWTTHDTGNSDAQAWSNWTQSFATKDIAGVGGLNLSAIVEKYPGYELGICSVSIEAPDRAIAAPSLNAAGFKGTVETVGSDWSGLWRNAAGTVFVNALMSTSNGRFELSMTGVGKLQ